MSSRGIALATGLAVAALAPWGAATAQSAAPAPCNGVVQVTDPAADSHHANTDVRRAWFDRAADGTVTANVEVSNLGPAIDHAENDRLFWRVMYSTPDGARRYGQATVRRGQTTATYEAGTVSGNSVTKQADTTGRLFPGKPGVVQIVLPAVEAGAILAKPVVGAAEASAVSTSWFERAPGGTDPTDPAETSVGADWRVSSCGAGGSGGGSTGGGGASGGGGTSGGGGAAVNAVGLDAAEMKIPYGRTATIRGAVSPAIGGVLVEVLDGAGAVRAKLTTDAQGHFAFNVKAHRTGAMRARAAGLTSGPVRVIAVPRLTLRAQRLSGGRLRLSGTATGLLSTPMYVERRSGRIWTQVAEARLRDGRFSVVLPRARRGAYRAVMDLTDLTVHSTTRSVR